MKKFIINTAVFLAIILISIFTVFVLADGTTDASYLKFTTPKQNSLIIGASRAAQGIQPAILNQELRRDDIYNYAFQNPTSPYGEIYSKSISKKLTANSSNGIFILDVNPWVLSKHIDTITNKEIFTEKGKFVDETKMVNISPNIEYLIESYSSSYIQIIKDKFQKGDYQTLFVDEFGWLRVTIESDMMSVNKRTELKINRYKKKLKFFHGYSNHRVNNLCKLIDFLKSHGELYLVRIPISNEMHSIEDLLLPNFDADIQKIADSLEVEYFNLTKYNDRFTYTDGNHLTIESGAKVSKLLAKLISENK